MAGLIQLNPIDLIGYRFVEFCQACRETGTVIENVLTKHPGEYRVWVRLPEGASEEVRERIEGFRMAA